jgi:cytoskeletal protein RodZ
MTQELVIVVLFTGLIGLLWAMTVAIWEGRHSTSQPHEADASGNTNEARHGESALQSTLRQQTSAA